MEDRRRPVIPQDKLWPLAYELTKSMPNCDMARMALMANMLQEMLYGQNTTESVRETYVNMAQSAYTRYDDEYRPQLYAEWQRCVDCVDCVDASTKL